MERELFFIKNSRTGKFIKTDVDLQNINLILQKDDKTVFCTRHQRWETPSDIEYGKVPGQDKVKYSCGKEETGLLLYQNYVPTTTKECDEFLSKPDSAYINKDGTTFDLYALRIRLNESKTSPFLIESHYFYRESWIEKIYQNHRISTIPKISIQMCYSTDSSPKTYNSFFYLEDAKLPSIVEEYAVNLLWEKYRNELSLKRTTPLTENAEKSGTDKIDALVRFPCEPGLERIAAFLDRQKITVSPNDRNAYYTVCTKLGIKSWKSLREAFDVNPEVLILTANLLRCGFKDINIISSIINDRIFITHVLPTDYLLGDNEPIKEYFHWALSRHSERSVWNTFYKNMKTYIPQNGNYRQRFSHIEDINDAASMFMTHQETVNEEIIKAVAKDGLSKYNHDLLSKEMRVKKNITFKYTEEQKKLEDEIDDYKFCLPEDSGRLTLIGHELHNCVGGYDLSVAQKYCTIVYVLENDEYVMCIEVRNSEVHQCRENYNISPEGKNKEVFDKWCQKHNLTFTKNRF